MTSLCPFNWGGSKATFCHDGFPSESPTKDGLYHCEAYISHALLSDVCGSKGCEIIVPIDGENYHITPCEDCGECPYEGCARLRKIENIPANIAALAVKHNIELREKAKGKGQ